MSLSNSLFWKSVDEMFLLNSSYAQRWLSLLLYSQSHEVKAITIEDVRELMLVDGSEYKQKSDLIKRVVYDPLKEINESDYFSVGFSYLYDKRKPILGFNIHLKFKDVSGVLSETYGPNHIRKIASDYKLPDNIVHEASLHPLAIAAMFQAHRDIVNQKVFIEKSKYLYMRKVLENSIEYLKPIHLYLKI